ncbi:MAG: undecaprenyl-phosphate glucose phosphotransferase [Candidatus Aminicenantes bacterium]|nr:MAG: undecaprenyl-phosphate glucose phosphotransferase [Candidatus Aminicenantes bacterium]
MAEEKHTPILRVLLMDLILLNIINLFFIFIIKQYNFKSPQGGEHYLMLLILFNLLWIMINVAFTRYRMELNRGIGVEIKKILVAVLLFTGMGSMFAFLFKNLFYSRLIIYGSITAFFSGLIVTHWIFFCTLRRIRKMGKLTKRVLIVGEDQTAIELANELNKNNDVDYDILVFIDGDIPEIRGDHRLITGKIADVKNILLKGVANPMGYSIGSRKNQKEKKVCSITAVSEDIKKKEEFDELYIVVSSSSSKELRDIFENADYYGIRVRVVPGFYHLVEQNFHMNLLNNIPIIYVNETPLDNYYNWLYKRLFDILFSLLALVLLSPFLIIIGLSIKLTSKGPVLYAAQRVGLKGNKFRLYKFRTMYNSGNNQEMLSTKENDSRVIPFGRFLRKNNLDELPQFYNVLKGNMSVVGPRPHRVYLDKKMQNEVDKYMIRHYIKPGMTGWAQVNGWRGPTSTREQKFQRTRCDLWYIKNWSFWLDLKIISLTVLGKKARKNAF